MSGCCACPVFACVVTLCLCCAHPSDSVVDILCTPFATSQTNRVTKQWWLHNDCNTTRVLLSLPTPSYVTPEQLVKSSVLREVLLRLKSRGRLARVVVDEAHCVSDWGVWAGLRV